MEWGFAAIIEVEPPKHPLAAILDVEDEDDEPKVDLSKLN